MNYDEYYDICKRSYTKNVNDKLVKEFYQKPVKVYEPEFFGSEYNQTVEQLANKIKDDFDNNNDCDDDKIMVKHTNIWKFHNEILKLSNILVPFLEENRYGCHLYVDKIYIYRTLQLENRISSYEWHYDNNPDEIVKTLIYLNDVNMDNSPYEYFKSPSNEGILGQCTRRGTECWYPAPNNSRVGHLIEGLEKQGYSSERVIGKRGTAISFINNSIHRANPVINGYRDVINIRVKPTIQKAPEYANPMFTTSYEHSGVVNQNPAHAWKSKV
tara:strand:- start:61 stop:873 length:813 start_codon:yes stop_codon:yes gene_type:complete